MIRIASLTLLAGLLLPAACLSAQTPAQVATRNVPDSLAAKAKINEDSARAVALKRVPGAVETVHLMQNSGKLEYVFGIKPTGKNAMERVTVNAMTGHLISVTAAGSTKAKSTTPHSS
jgi:uncharacterized membrane protein YkoI